MIYISLRQAVTNIKLQNTTTLLTLRYFITGGAGFAGSNFIDLMKKDPENDIIVLDNCIHGDSDYFDKLSSDPQIELVRGDIRDQKDVERCLPGIDVVLHLAALIEVPYSVRNPIETHDVNVNGTLNILEACRKKDVSRIIYPSSNLTYGEPVYLPVDEAHPQNPVSPYAVTKCSSEKYCYAYYKTYGLKTTMLRFSNLYGPRGLGVINIFIRAALEGRPLEIQGGSQMRTFTHIYDAYQGALKCLKNFSSIGEIFNIAGPESESIEGISGIIAKEIPGVKINHVGSRVGDVTSSRYHISNEKAAKLLGYEPDYDLRKGIRQVIDFEKSL
ncbi:NAD-dependent epimerase/dehydratase family protein [Candidatus Bathyarchaeota archaeon]|nr:NAD-dependent epimerase/dehydratase family protein [Candidatus Bathyarchaeota archaeon]